MFSGNKGYRVYVFLDMLYSFEAKDIEVAKQMYLALQKILLMGFKRKEW